MSDKAAIRKAIAEHRPVRGRGQSVTCSCGLPLISRKGRKLNALAPHHVAAALDDTDG